MCPACPIINRRVQRLVDKLLGAVPSLKKAVASPAGGGPFTGRDGGKWLASQTGITSITARGTVGRAAYVGV